MSPEPPGSKPPIFSELGITGLWQFSGYLDEEKLLQLRGWRGMQVFREMQDNDATVGALEFAFEMLLRTCDFWFEPASDSPQDLEYATFMEEVIEDMSDTWEETIAHILTELTFGWSCVETVFKRRLGPDQTDPASRSKFNDGLIGWRKLAPRAQETLQHWEFDEDGGVRGWWQQPPQGGGLIYLPIEKLLLFRTTNRKNNPEGRSILRNAYVAYYRKKNMERIEAIGVERQLAGLPVMYVPQEWLAEDADQATKAQVANLKKIIRNLRIDEQMGLMLPTIIDPETKVPLVKFELLASATRTSSDLTNGIITRYQKDILTSCLADILIMGQSAVGSYALSQNKTTLLYVAMGAIMDAIVAVFNRYGIPRLFKLNGFKCQDFPKLAHGDLDKQDIGVLSQALMQMVQAGGIMLGSKQDENYLRELLGLPELIDDSSAQWTDDPGKNVSQRVARLARMRNDRNLGLKQSGATPPAPTNPLPPTPQQQAGIAPTVAKILQGVPKRQGKFIYKRR